MPVKNHQNTAAESDFFYESASDLALSTVIVLLTLAVVLAVNLVQQFNLFERTPSAAETSRLAHDETAQAPRL